MLVIMVTVTAPCQGRTVLNIENQVPKGQKCKGDELFLLQLELIALLKPRRVVSEMTPPNERSHSDHSEVVSLSLIHI